MRWTQWQSVFDPHSPNGVRLCWRNRSVDRLVDYVVDVLVRRGAEQTWPGWFWLSTHGPAPPPTTPGSPSSGDVR